VPKGNAVIAGDIDKPERTVLIDGGHTTVKPAACVTAQGSIWETCQRELEEGDSRTRGGLPEHVVEEDNSQVLRSRPSTGSR
jgi:hypothetical protein